MIYNLIFLSLISISLNAREPTLAILKNVYSNDIQQFTYQNYSFTCKPYGIISIEDVYNNSNISTICKKRIEKFYIHKSKAKYFSARLLKLFQSYHIKIKDTKCLIYSSGIKTLSESLIENGLAVKFPYLKDEIYSYKFETAQKRAEYYELGLHKDPVLKNCIIFYKSN